MKKNISILAAAVIAAGCFSACGQGGTDVGEITSKNEQPKIITTIFPEYDWVKEILGGNEAELTLLLDNGVDLHSYLPTAEDILKISDCDLFIYVGGESDEWVADALKEAVNKDMRVLNLLDILGGSVKEEEVIEGMQEESEDDSAEETDEDAAEYDEHVWLSLKNAQTFCEAITDALCEIDAENASRYKNNAQAYMEKLSSLDEKYTLTAASAPVKTLLFGDRFPFRYMTDDYGLNYYAAFAGCSAETEASFETIMFLAKKTDELGLNNIIHIEGSDGKIAETIRQNTASKSQRILTLDSMQSTTARDISDGASYLSVMEKNLETLAEALQ